MVSYPAWRSGAAARDPDALAARHAWRRDRARAERGHVLASCAAMRAAALLRRGLLVTAAREDGRLISRHLDRARSLPHARATAIAARRTKVTDLQAGAPEVAPRRRRRAAGGCRRQASEPPAASSRRLRPAARPSVAGAGGGAGAEIDSSRRSTTSRRTGARAKRMATSQQTGWSLCAPRAGRRLDLARSGDARSPARRRRRLDRCECRSAPRVGPSAGGEQRDANAPSAARRSRRRRSSARPRDARPTSWRCRATEWSDGGDTPASARAVRVSMPTGCADARQPSRPRAARRARSFDA